MTTTAYNYGVPTATQTDRSSGKTWTNITNADDGSTGTYAFSELRFSFGSWQPASKTTDYIDIPIAAFTEIPSGAIINSVNIGVYRGMVYTQGGGGSNAIQIAFRDGSTTYHNYSAGGTTAGTWSNSTDNSPASNSVLRTSSNLNIRIYCTATGSPTDPTRFHNRIFTCRVRVNYTSATVPPAPPDPTWTGLGTDGGSNSGKATGNIDDVNGNGGSAFLEAEIQIDDNTSFNNGSGRRQTWTTTVTVGDESHQFTGMANGVTYYVRGRYRNSVGWGAYNPAAYNSITTWNFPSTPVDPTLSDPSPPSAQQLNTSSINPSNGGKALDNVEIQIDNGTSPDWSGGSLQTYTKGSAPSSPQTHLFTGVTHGEVRAVRARYHNSVGWSPYNTSPYNSLEAEDVPDVPSVRNFDYPPTIRHELVVSQDSPDNRGASLSDIEVHISTDNSFPADNPPTVYTETWLKGSAPTDPQAHTFTGLEDGTQYFGRVRYENEHGWSNWQTYTQNTYTLCATPNAPSITATAVGELTIDWSGNNTAGAANTNAWKIEWDEDIGFGSPTLLGDFDLATTSTTHTSLGDGVIRYYRVQLKNLGNVLSEQSTNGAGTTWDLPDEETVAPTIDNSLGSRLKITSVSPYPNDNGSTITHMQVWRSSTSGGSYSDVSGDVAIGGGSTEFTDWSVSEGETWYYKVLYKNAVGYSPLGSAFASATVTALFISLPSYLKVILRSELSKSTTLRVNATQEIFVPSKLAVKVFGLQISLSTNIRVVGSLQVFLPSTLKVLITEVATTPTISFTRYEKNDVTSGTIDNDFDFGAWDGTRTMNAIVVDPYENTMVNPDKHEFYYSVSPKSGTENFYMTPLTNGMVSIDGATSGTIYEASFRGIDLEEQKVWITGTTEIIVEFDVDGDWAGNGSRIDLTGAWANTGTVWTAPSVSGSNVLDVPHMYNGSMMVMNQPTDWDGDSDHKIHDWLPLQVNVGHAVEVKDFSMVSGTHEDSIINLQGNLNTLYDMSFRAYHEHPNEWEWYSGATKIDSGTLTVSQDTWQFIDNVNLGKTHLSGTTSFYLKLFCRSGTVLHPDPVRVITVNKII